jgi:hypothetical protein
MRLHPDFTVGALGAAYAGVAARQPALTGDALAALARLVPARAQLYQSIAAAVKEPARAPAALALLNATTELPPSERVAWHTALGDRAGALRAVRQGYEEHADVTLPFVLAHPLAASLRSDPEVKAILEDIGIR